ncbi:MAG: type IV secretion system protein [Actinomycetota bacterium]|nr:type IV secretion system protein [Actinomycetota bacterium]
MTHRGARSTGTARVVLLLLAAIVLLAGLSASFFTGRALAQADTTTPSPGGTTGPANELDGMMQPEETTGGGTTTPEDSPLEEGEKTRGLEDVGGGNSGGGEERCGIMDMECYAEKGFVAILRSIADWLSRGLELILETLKSAAFALPKPEGDLLEKYNTVANLVKPAIVVAFLLLGFTTLLRSANLDLHFATQDGLRKILIVAGGLAFFPNFLAMLSDVSFGLSEAMWAEADPAAALAKLIFDSIIVAVTAALVPGVGLTAVGLWAIVCLIPALILSILVLVVAVAKNVLFLILMMVAPFAIVAYVIPGLSDVAGAWLRGILACAIIPILYSIELTLGTWIVGAPQLVFPNWTGITPLLSTTISVVLLWLMYKTPFKVLSWAFNSYHPGSGAMGAITRAFAVQGAMKGVGMAAGLFTGGAGGAAATVANNLANSSPSGPKSPQLNPGKSTPQLDAARPMARSLGGGGSALGRSLDSPQPQKALPAPQKALPPASSPFSR